MTESIANDDSEESRTRAEPVSIAQVDLDKGVDLEDETTEDNGELSVAEQIARRHSLKNHNYEAQDDGLDEEFKEEFEPEPEPLEPEMVEIKVNGKVRSVERSKIDEAGGIDVYQKRLAGEDILKEAGETRKLVDQEITSLRERENLLIARELALSNQTDEQKRAKEQNNNLDLPNGDHSKALSEKARAVREALFEGEEGAIDQALIDLMQSARENSATQDDVLAAVGDKAYNRVLETLESDNFERDRVSAVGMFNSEFEDIAGDPELKAMADDRTARLHKENPSWTPSQIIRKAAEDTREWVTSLTGGDNSSTTDSEAELAAAKLDTKRSLSNVKTSTGRVQPKQGPKQETNSEYIQRLRGQRGLDAT